LLEAPFLHYHFAHRYPKNAVTLGGSVMDDLRCQQFFSEPCQPLQRRYEALRAFFVERRPLPDIARQFGFAHGTLRNLVCQFRAHCQADGVPPFSLHQRADDRVLPVPSTAQRVPKSQTSPIAARSR
jgi:hypothetical protein